MSLDDDVCSFLVATIARDLDLDAHFPEFPRSIPLYFEPAEPSTMRLPGHNFQDLFQRLVGLSPDADTFFYCLAKLHKSRLKYAEILRTQPVPTIDQVGPRGLLQYGNLSDRSLVGLLFWRKWMYDIDNRAAQEAGYLFEPIIAAALGGVPYGAARSPILRGGTGSGRQVDCIRDHHAYEIKLRITIAASGQGRWREELAFPSDCRASGYAPVLVVFDPTPNSKLIEIRNAFLQAGGDVHIGQDAWNHLESVAGETIGRFLRRYVRDPIESLLSGVPETLPELTLTMSQAQVSISLSGERMIIPRAQSVSVADVQPEELPEDIDEEVPGP